MTKKRIHTIYGIALSVMIAVAGICLCVACVDIYRSGAEPFSRESVAAAFRHIALPVYLCLALIPGGWILDIFLADERKKPADKQYRMILAKMQEKLDLTLCEPTLQSSIITLRKKRQLLKAVGAVLLSVCTGIFLAYSLNPANYLYDQTGITPSIIGAMFLFVPCCAIPFIYGIVASSIEMRSIRAEIDLTKSAIAAGARAESPVPAANKPSGIAWLRLVILFVSVGCLTFGFFTGGTADVLTKAINICTECVGLG